MGSMESLSSHSSEQNTCSKAASSRHKTSPSKLDLLHLPSPQLSNGPRSTVCVSSPESSSREDTGRTDGESEDALSLSSVSIAPRLSPAPKKAPHCNTDLKSALMNRSVSPSLKSLHVSDGRSGFIVIKKTELGCRTVAIKPSKAFKVLLFPFDLSAV